MCPPLAAIVPLLSFTAGAAQAVIGHQAAVAEADAQNQRHEQNRIEANRAAANQFAHQQNQILQEQAVASQELENAQAEGLAARATARTAAGESGIAGLSVDALLGDFHGQQGRFEQSLDTNFQQQESFLRAEMDATQSQNAARINSVPTAARPSFAGAAVRILGSGVSAIGQFQRSS